MTSTKETSQLDVSRNILDQYDTSTYHFRLFMVSPKYYMANEVGPESEQIIIAESGGTAIGIDQVTIKHVHGYHSSVEGSATAQTINITLTQPFSATLIDQLYGASLQLGIPNYTKCPYFLELSFLGNTADESAPTLITGKKWIWPMILVKVEADIKANGTRFEIESAVYNDLALSDQANTLMENVTIKQAYDTVDTALNNFIETLRLKEKEKVNRFESLVENEWEIKYGGKDGEEIRKSRIIPNTPQEATERQNDLQFTDGTSIQKVIQEILSCSEFLQDRAKTSVNKNENKNDVPDLERKVMKTLYKIHTDVEIIDYDPKRGDYARRYTYIITDYKISTISSSPDEALLTEQDSKDRAYFYYYTKKIAKHYNYIYTGKNQDVYDFDIRFNTSWYIPTPRQGGKTTHLQSLDQGSRKSVKTEDAVNGIVSNFRNATQTGFEPYSVEREDQIKKSIEDVGSSINKAKEEVLSIREKIASGIKVDGDIERINSLNESVGQLETQLSELSKIKLDAPSSVIGKLNDVLLEGMDRKAKGEKFIDQYYNDTKGAIPFRQYVEDINVSEIRGDIQKNINKLIPLTYLEYGEDETSTSSTQSMEEGRIFFSSLFSQANRTAMSDMITIDLNIKGDPFWLGNSRYKNGKIASHYDMINDETMGVVDGNLVQYFTSEKYFLFTARAPQASVIFNETDDAMDNNTILNAIYGVITSTHTFQDGLYKCTLNAVRDFLTDIKYTDIEKYLDTGELPESMQTNVAIQSESVGDTNQIKPAEPPNALTVFKKKYSEYIPKNPFDEFKEKIISSVHQDNKTAKLQLSLDEEVIIPPYQFGSGLLASNQVKVIKKTQENQINVFPIVTQSDVSKGGL